MSIATEEQAAVDAAPKQLLIGGEWRDASGGATLAVEDPATGEAFCEVADATADDAKAALDAACEAQADWAATPPNERSEILPRAFELNERADELALLMTLEMGKAVAESKAEIAYAAEFFRWFAGEALRIDGCFKVAGNAQSRVLVMRQPVGPCFFITPWNFPTAMGTRKIGPAIAAGCTMVVKPASRRRSRCWRSPRSSRRRPAAGRPQRDHQLVLERRGRAGDRGPAAAKALVHRLDRGRPQPDRAGRGQMLKVSMELGGNAPFLIFDDADLDAAVEGAMIAKMRNIGEAAPLRTASTSPSRWPTSSRARLAERMGRSRSAAAPRRAWRWAR